MMLKPGIRIRTIIIVMPNPRLKISSQTSPVLNSKDTFFKTRRCSVLVCTHLLPVERLVWCHMTRCLRAQRGRVISAVPRAPRRAPSHSSGQPSAPAPGAGTPSPGQSQRSSSYLKYKDRVGNDGVNISLWRIVNFFTNAKVSTVRVISVNSFQISLQMMTYAKSALMLQIRLVVLVSQKKVTLVRDTRILMTSFCDHESRARQVRKLPVNWG